MDEHPLPAPSAVAPASSPAGPRSRWLCLALALAAVVAYWNSFSAPLLLDDIASVAENPSIRTLWPLTSVLSPPPNVGLGGRPVANVTFALNYAWGGTSVTGYHVVNLAIHVLAGLLVFSLLRRTLAQPVLTRLVPPSAHLTVAFAAALLWLLHPLHTEAVTYISQRSESLMGLFYLLTLHAFVRGATERRSGWFAISGVACALGMATKEVMVTAPVLVLLYDRTFISGSIRAAWQRHRRVFLALAASWALLAFLLLDVHERGVGYKVVTAWQYALTESRAIGHYLRLALWPHPLVFDYGTTIAGSLRDVWPHAVAVVLLLSATAVALWRRPVAGFVGAWVFIALSPTSSVVPVAGQPMAEHRMYLPLVALVAAAVIAAHRILGRRTFLAFTIFVAIAAGYATLDRNRDYRSALALWSETVHKAPQNARAHAGLGAALLEQGDVPAAISALERALQLDPQLAEAHNNLATALIDAGRPEESIAHFTAALELRPGVASTHYNFGNVLLQLGRTAEAIAQQQQALIAQPDFAEAECGLANALAASGRIPEAIPHYETSLRLQPGLVAAEFGLANALANSGRFAEAVPHYEATLRAVPNSLEAHYNLANLFLAMRRFPDALRHYEAVIQLKPDFADAHYNAGNALVLSGRSAEAMARYEAALALQPDFPAARANLDALRNAAAPTL